MPPRLPTPASRSLETAQPLVHLPQQIRSGSLLRRGVTKLKEDPYSVSHYLRPSTGAVRLRQPIHRGSLVRREYFDPATPFSDSHSTLKFSSVKSIIQHEGVTVAVAPPPSSPLLVLEPAPVEDRDEEMIVGEDNNSPPSLENEPDANEGVEGDAPPPPHEPEAVQEGGDVLAAGEIAPAGPAAGDFTCEICGARYPTEKAMFGHLRSHKDRGWRGAFSPPTFTMEEFAEYQEHLVKPEEEQLREIEAEERAAAGERVVLDVDLNAEAEEFILPDLNLPPPHED